MSEKIKQARLEKMKHDLLQSFAASMIIVALAVFYYVVVTVTPHIGTANDVLTMPQWQYFRDTTMFLLGGIAITVFCGLLMYWVYQDEMLQRKQKKELIRETIKEVLNEERKK